MDSVLRIVLFVGLVIYFLCLAYLLKKKRIILKYTILWLIVGLVMCIIGVFPQYFSILIHYLGIKETTNGLFAVIVFSQIILLISITSIISYLNEKIRLLSQTCSMYEKRIYDLERVINVNKSN